MVNDLTYMELCMLYRHDLNNNGPLATQGIANQYYYHKRHGSFGLNIRGQKIQEFLDKYINVLEESTST